MAQNLYSGIPGRPGFGATASIIVAGGLYCEDGHPNHDGSYDSPGIQKLLYGAIFPVGLLMVVFTGAELLTSNIMCDAIDVIHRFSWRTVRGLLKNWTVSWFGNFCGALFCAYFLAWHAELFASDPWHIFVVKLAVKKYKLKWYQVFLRGMGCNALVCLAVYLSYAAEDVIGKWFNMWYPIMAFAAIGYEHCVANMYMLPMALLYGADEMEAGITWNWILRNIALATVGNICGALFLVDFFFWYGFGRGYLRANPLNWSKPKPKPKDAPVPLGRPRKGDRDMVQLKQWAAAEGLGNPAEAAGALELRVDPGEAPAGAGPAQGHLHAYGQGAAPCGCVLLVEGHPDASHGSGGSSGHHRSCRYMKRYVRKDGRVVRVTVNAEVEMDESGRPRRLIASVADQENPGQQEGHISIGVDDAGHASTIQAVDDAFCSLLGYAPDELRDRPLLAVTHPDDVSVSDVAIGTARHDREESVGLLSNRRSTTRSSSESAPIRL
eukprot:tig00000448_g925.t1